MDRIRIVCLGGLDEFYKSCTLVEINDDIFVIECGLKFPDVTKPGIDYVIPRHDYLIENKQRIKAYILTYGHDSVIGGLPYIIKKAPAPVYCSDITKAFLDMFCTHNNLDISGVEFHIVEPTSDFMIAGHKISTFSTCTNIAKSFGVALDSDQGNIIYLGNCVFDNNKDTGFSLDIAQVAKISASKPTLIMLQDSTYATHSGYTNPHYRLIDFIQKPLRDAQGRVFIALEAPDIYNVIAFINEAIKNNRKIICYDESTQDLVDVLIRTGCLKATKNNFLPMEEVNRARPQEVAVVMAAFGKKLFSRIALLATHQNDDQYLSLNANDTFFVASHAENDSEIAETNALNDLYRNDCKIIRISPKQFLKMHSSQEDLKTAISIFRPRYYLPILGRLVDLFANAKVALGMNIGLNHNSVFVLDNGMILEIQNYLAKILPNKILTGNILVDGKGIGDIASNVLEERQKFSDDGVIILAATISKSKREIVLGPDIQTRGLVFVKESDSLLKEIEKVFVLNIKAELAKFNYSISYMEMTIKEQVFKLIRRVILKSPTIIPIIVEIE